MIAAAYGKRYSIAHLREKSYINKEGVSIKGICEAAESIGMKSLVAKLPLLVEKGENDSALSRAPMPCIVHWNQNHFVVVQKISRNKVSIADPAVGKRKVTHSEFNKAYAPSGSKGVAIILEPSTQFFQKSDVHQKRGFGFILSLIHI